MEETSDRADELGYFNGPIGNHPPHCAMPPGFGPPPFQEPPAAPFYSAPPGPPRNESDEVDESDATPKAADDPQDLARRVENLAPAIYLNHVLKPVLGDVDGPTAAFLYLENVSAKSGCGDDPLQKMLCAQIVNGNHTLSRLYGSIATAKTPEAIFGFTLTVTKLQAELRKSMLALRDLQKVTTQAGTFIERVIHVEERNNVPNAKKVDTELGSITAAAPAKEFHNESRYNRPVIAKPAPSGGRPI